MHLRRTPRRARPSPRCGCGAAAARARRARGREAETPSQSRLMPSASVRARRPRGRPACTRLPGGVASGAGPSHSSPTRKARIRNGAPPTWSGWACVTRSASTRRTRATHSSGATRLSPGSKRASREPPASTSSARPRRRAQQQAVALADVDHVQVQPAVRVRPQRPASERRARRPRGPRAPGRDGRERAARGRQRRGRAARSRARASARSSHGASGPRSPDTRSARAAIQAADAGEAGRRRRGARRRRPRRRQAATADESGTAARFSSTAAGARRWKLAASIGASAACAAIEAASAHLDPQRQPRHAAGQRPGEQAGCRASRRTTAGNRRPPTDGRAVDEQRERRPGRAGCAASASTSSARPSEHGAGHQRGAHHRHVAPDEHGVERDDGRR